MAIDVTELKVKDKITIGNSEITSVETTLTGSSTAIPRADAVKGYVDTSVSNIASANDAMVFKGTIGTGGTVTALPTTHSVGWTYRVITAGTYAGVTTEVGDLIIALVSRSGSSNANSDWTVVQTNIDGAVTGPASAVSANVASFNGTGGKVIQDSGVAFETSLTTNSNTKAPTSKAVADYVTGLSYLPTSGGTITGGLIIDGSINSGGYELASNYVAAGTNIILKGDSNGRSAIFFQSEKDGTNINHSSDFGFIQFHPYGRTGSSGESNELIIGVSNDSPDDILILNTPDNNGVKVRVGASTTNNTVWHSGNDGTGSGLDADLLDGNQASAFVLKAGDTMTGSLNIQAGNNTYGLSTGLSLRLGLDTADKAGAIRLDGTTDGAYGLIQETDSNLHIDAVGGKTYINYYDGDTVMFGNGASGVVAVMGPDGDLWKGSADNTGSVYWHAGNDGAGSGLDADTVDGYQASSLWRSDGGTWNANANISLPQTANNQEWSFDITRNGYTGGYWHVWDSALSTLLRVNAYDGAVSAPYSFSTPTATITTVNSTTENVSGNLSAGRYYQSANGIPTNNLGGPTVTEMALFDEQFYNQTAFYDITKLKFYTSTNGSTWTEVTSISDTNKRALVGGDAGSSIVIPNLTPYYRIEITNSGSYVFLNALYMYWSSNSHSTTVKIRARRRSDETFVQWTNSSTTVSAWPGHLYMPFSTIPFLTGGTSSGHYDIVQIDFQPTWAGGAYSTTDINLIKLQIWGGYPAGKRNIYSTDENKNVAFPAALTGTRLFSTIATGTSPLSVTSTTVNTNLNADLLDGYHSSSFIFKSGDTMTGQLELTGSSPQLKFSDTDASAHDFWIHVNNDRFYILTDRNNDGAWDGTYPFELRNSDSTGFLYGDKIWTAGNDGTGSGLDADLLDGLHASSFQRQIDESIVAIGSPATSSGTWTTADTDDWGTPRIGSEVARWNDNDGMLQYNVPAGMDTAYISHLTWSSGGYVDAYGVQADGGLVFLRRINTRQAVENGNEGSNGGNPNQHDGSTITLVGTGLSTYSAIRLQNRLGRFHLTGMSFTSNRLQGTEGTGMVHPGQISHTGTGSGLDADLLDGNHASAFALSSHTHNYAGSSSAGGAATNALNLNINDVRDTSKTPAQVNSFKANFEFNNLGIGSSTWWSILTAKGWDGNYAAWQLAGPASVGENKDDLYFRGGQESTWGTWRRILHDGNISSSAVALTGDQTIAGTKTFSNNVIISGDLTISGTTTNINTTNLVVEDKNIVLGDVTTPTDVTADGGGITLKGATDKTITWVDSTDRWTSNQVFGAPNYVSTVATGTQPYATTSTTVNTNLNADLLDGLHEGSFLRSDANDSFSGWIQVSNNNGLYVDGANATLNMDLDVSTNTFNVRGTSNNNIFTVYAADNSVRGDKVTLGARTNTSTYGGNVAGLTLNSVAEIRSAQASNPPALTFHYENLATRHILLASNGDINVVSPTSENSGVAVLKVNGNTVWHAGNDGASSTLDADLLDGNHASAFVLKSGDTMTGSLTVDTSADFDQTAITSLTSAPIVVPEVNVGSTNTFLPFLHQTSLYSAGYRTHMNLGLFKQANGWGDGETGFYVGLGGNDSNPTQFYKMTYGGTIKWINNSGTTYNFWSNANHGASSGLDADLLDGNHASAFYLASNPSGYTSNTGTVTSVATGSGLTGGTITTSGTLSVDSTVVRTTGAQSISGVKTLSNSFTGSGTNRSAVISTSLSNGAIVGPIDSSALYISATGNDATNHIMTGITVEATGGATNAVLDGYGIDGISLSNTIASPGKWLRIKPVSGTTASTILQTNSSTSGSITVTLPSATGTVALTSNINDATLTLAAGTGVSLSATPTFSANASSNKTITITNSSPDQTVALTGSGLVSISGTYPNFTITGNADSNKANVSHLGALELVYSGTTTVTHTNATDTTTITLNSGKTLGSTDVILLEVDGANSATTAGFTKALVMIRLGSNQTTANTPFVSWSSLDSSTTGNSREWSVLCRYSTSSTLLFRYAGYHLEATAGAKTFSTIYVHRIWKVVTE